MDGFAIRSRPSSGEYPAGGAGRRTGGDEAIWNSQTNRAPASRWTSRAGCGPAARNPQTRNAVVVSGRVQSSVGCVVPDQSRPTGAGAPTIRKTQTDDDDRYLFSRGGHVNFDDKRCCCWSSFGPCGASRAGSTRRSGTRRTTRSRPQGWSAFGPRLQRKREGATRTRNRISPADPTKDKRLNVQYLRRLAGA